MSEEIEAKLDVLNGMNSTLGKITNVQVRLELAGENDLARQMDIKRKALLQQIESLQGQIADEWTTNAAVLTEHLREENRKVQARINDIRKKVGVANNAVQIIGQIDDALDFLSKLVP